MIQERLEAPTQWFSPAPDSPASLALHNPPEHRLGWRMTSLVAPVGVCGSTGHNLVCLLPEGIWDSGIPRGRCTGMQVLAATRTGPSLPDPTHSGACAPGGAAGVPGAGRAGGADGGLTLPTCLPWPAWRRLPGQGMDHGVTVGFERSRCFSLESLFADLCPRAYFCFKPQPEVRFQTPSDLLSFSKSSSFV